MFADATVWYFVPNECDFKCVLHVQRVQILLGSTKSFIFTKATTKNTILVTFKSWCHKEKCFGAHLKIVPQHTQHLSVRVWKRSHCRKLQAKEINTKYSHQRSVTTTRYKFGKFLPGLIVFCPHLVIFCRYTHSSGTCKRLRRIKHSFA